MRAWLLGVTYTSGELGGMVFSGRVVGAGVLECAHQRGCSIYTVCEVSPSSSEKSCCYGQSGKC